MDKAHPANLTATQRATITATMHDRIAAAYAKTGDHRNAKTARDMADKQRAKA